MSDIYLIVVGTVTRRRETLYDINGDYYVASTLRRFTGDILRVFIRIKIDLRRLNSLGFLVVTSFYLSKWFIATLDSNNTTIVYWSGPDALTPTMDYIHPLSIPDLTRYVPGQNELPRLDTDPTSTISVKHR